MVDATWARSDGAREGKDRPCSREGPASDSYSASMGGWVELRRLIRMYTYPRHATFVYWRWTRIQRLGCSAVITENNGAAGQWRVQWRSKAQSTQRIKAASALY